MAERRSHLILLGLILGGAGVYFFLSGQSETRQFATAEQEKRVLNTVMTSPLHLKRLMISFGRLLSCTARAGATGDDARRDS